MRRVSRILVAAIALAALISTSTALADKTVTTLLNGVTAAGASSSVDSVGGLPTDHYVFQATYPAGVTVTLEATLGTTWTTVQTWSASGVILTAPILGGTRYRANTTVYAGAVTKTVAGLDDATFSGTYSGGVAGDYYEVAIDGAPAPATGSITCVAKAALVDGETLTLDDGTNAATVFEFDVAGDGVAGGNTQVNVSTDTTAIQVATRLANAINTVAAGLAITATAVGDGTITLANDANGPSGNVAITETVADAGFVVAGMSGGHQDTFTWNRSGGTPTAGVDITGAAQSLGQGVSATFAATTGHTLGDKWRITYGGVTVLVTASGSTQVTTY